MTKKISAITLLLLMLFSLASCRSLDDLYFGETTVKKWDMSVTLSGLFTEIPMGDSYDTEREYILSSDDVMLYIRKDDLEYFENRSNFALNNYPLTEYIAFCSEYYTFDFVVQYHGDIPYVEVRTDHEIGEEVTENYLSRIFFYKSADAFYTFEFICVSNDEKALDETFKYAESVSFASIGGN